MNTNRAIILLLVFGQFYSSVLTGQSQTTRLKITPLTGNVFVYTTYQDIGTGDFPSNSLYVVTKNKVLLLDTPWDSTQFQPLLDSIEKRHHKKVALCISTHFHADRTAGLDYFRKKGIKTYVSTYTDKFCKARNEKRPEFTFTSDTTFLVDDYEFKTFYPGEGHTKDNIVIWLPKDRVLYGGCFIKSKETNSLGNVADANLVEWPLSVSRVMQKYKDARFVIPGHFAWGDASLLSYTQDLVKGNMPMTIDSLISHKAYFTARKLYREYGSSIPEYNQLKIEAYLNNVFNKPAESNAKIEALFKKYSLRLVDSVKYKFLSLQQANYSKLYQYRKATEVLNDILTRYRSVLNDDELKDLTNTKSIWLPLSNQPAQQVIVHDSTAIKIKRDVAGLANLPVTANGQTIDFIFDTGANLSTITESTAKKIGVIVFNTSIDVGGITGNMIQSKIGICPKLQLGNIEIRNAVFLVFPDSALAISQIKLQINGILGFPVIAALKQIQINKKDEFSVPKYETTNMYSNMAIDYLTPIIEIEGDSYTFDTGADNTILYRNFYVKNKSDIDGKLEESDLHFGGAGRSITTRGYNYNFKPVINGKQLTLKPVMLLKEDLGEKSVFYYGNIGQDVIRSFDTMIINFDQMFIDFK